MSTPDVMPDLAPDYASSLLVTDLYQLNMVEAYLADGLTGEAIFEVFVRTLAPKRGFLLAAGLEQAVRYALNARMSEAEAAWLTETGRFSQRCLDYLRDFRFTGHIDALPEGTLCFAEEPLLRITAPLPEAQLLETRLLNLLQYQTMVASKAARMRLAAPSADLVDFGLRRAHSGEAGVLAARAAYLAGFLGTATVAAGRAYGLPLLGTMAHAYIQAHEDERAAFASFARARPDQTVFLLDTYDIPRAAERLTALAPELAAEGISLRGVRLDSGDLTAEAKRVRAILDGARLQDVRIFASGGLDESTLQGFVKAGAPIAAYGLGTALVTADDMPSLDITYKLKSYDGRPTRKLSSNKSYWPGPVQIWRERNAEGRLHADHLTCADEAAPSPKAEALLQPIVREGRLCAPLEDVHTARTRAAEALASLPTSAASLEAPEPLTAHVSPALRALAAEVDRRLG